MINKELLEKMLQHVPNNKKVVLVNIGTDKVIADALGCLVGDMLEKRNVNIEFYGTLNYPIHARNVKEMKKQLNKKHKNDYIIGIDACIHEERKFIDKIKFKNKPLYPGKGVGKKLGEIGESQIVGYTVTSVDEFREKRLFSIYEMSNEIADTIEEFVKIRN